MSEEKENHVVEWKESWRDEYLKWICGFANAQGGTLIIGKDDTGNVIGVDNAEKLLNDIPNKARDLLGVMVDVNLHSDGGKDYVEIGVASYPNPISYKGQYHFRSGSTKQELKGSALDRFLLRKQRRTWDSVPVPRVSVEDLSSIAIDCFRELSHKSQRLDDDTLDESNRPLLEKLHLFEGEMLKRAGVLLFHPDPEMFFTGSFIKIGYFRDEADLLYHDEIHGDLFTQSSKSMDILLTKYLKAGITYEGVHRVETFPVPPEALREAMYNAIVHRDYATGTPIQIKVYPDKLSIWNSGELPLNWTVEDLLGDHSSQPFNPDIANAFFRAGEIETWGRGIKRIIEACRKDNFPDPVIKYRQGGVYVEFEFIGLGSSIGSSIGGSIGGSIELTDRQREILGIIAEKSKISYRELAKVLEINESAVKKHLDSLKNKGALERIGGTRGYWKVKYRE